jgi:hypothetical protein
VCSDNTSDGIKLTATNDRNTIVGVSIANNGGYGINIAASTCDNNQIIAPAFDTNASGDINDSGTNTVILPNVPSFIAEENLTLGNFVGVSNLVTGKKVARALRYVTSTAHGITTPLNDNQLQNSNNHCVAIGGDKFVYLTYTAASADTLFAQVGTVDRTTMSFTLGTVATVTTGFIPSTSGLTYTLCKLDTDKFIVIYSTDAGTSRIAYAKVGTVSGSTISFGSEQTIYTGAGGTTIFRMVADFISTDKGVYFQKVNAASSETYAICFTVSGTTVTTGTPFLVSSSLRGNNPSYVKKIATDKFVLVEDVTNIMYAQACTISGTTITGGAEKTISTSTHTAFEAGLQVVSHATDAFVVKAGNNTIIAVACTVSGTTITNGTTLSISTSSTPSGIYTQSATEFYIPCGEGKRILKVTLSGTTLTDNGIVMQETNSTGNDYGTIAIDNGYFILFQGACSQSTTNVNMFIQGMSNQFFGVANKTVSRGGSVGIVINGKVGGQSGLSPGAKYQVTSTGLTFASSIASTSTLDKVYVTAISDTEVLLN